MNRQYPDDDAKPCRCPACGWTGTLGQTHDYEPEPGETVCVCPKCSDEIPVKPLTHKYQIDPRPEALGGGWKLTLFEADCPGGSGCAGSFEEVGGGVFEAGQEGYSAALETAQGWLSDCCPE